jgi:hypothetical protein
MLASALQEINARDCIYELNADVSNCSEDSAKRCNSLGNIRKESIYIYT